MTNYACIQNPYRIKQNVPTDTSEAVISLLSVDSNIQTTLSCSERNPALDITFTKSQVNVPPLPVYGVNCNVVVPALGSTPQF